jgi:hypothetical protein
VRFFEEPATNHPAKDANDDRDEHDDKRNDIEQHGF